MSRFDARLAKIEASIGRIDSERYMQAEFDLQPKVHALYWQSREEHWPASQYLDKWMDLLRTLPANPKIHAVTPEKKQREIDAILGKLTQTRDGLEAIIDPHGLDELTQEIRERNDVYLREKGIHLRRDSKGTSIVTENRLKPGPLEI